MLKKMCMQKPHSLFPKAEIHQHEKPWKANDFSRQNQINLQKKSRPLQNIKDFFNHYIISTLLEYIKEKSYG